MQIVLPHSKTSGRRWQLVLNTAGALAAREMPSVYPDDIFPKWAPARELAEIVDAQMGSMLELLLKFESYKVFVRQATNCWLNGPGGRFRELPRPADGHQRCAQAGGGSHGTNPTPAPAQVAAAAPAAPGRRPAPVKPQATSWLAI